MSAEAIGPIRPFSSDDVPWTEWSPVPGVAIRFRQLSEAALGDDCHVGVAIEELAPGARSAPAHWHVFEEEHVFILDGALTLRLGEATYPMKAGDYVCFPAGQKAGHSFLNSGEGPCAWLMIGERNPNDVCVMPDSGKVVVRALEGEGRDSIFDVAGARTYLDGEETG